MLSICVVGYAFSPIDLIPDPIPVLGYLDDLVIVPVGIALVIRLISDDLLAEHRGTAQSAARGAKPDNWIIAGVIIAMWIGLFVGVAWLVYRRW